MKAIILPYCEDQNEPSIPYKEIFDLDQNDIAARNKLLKDLFVTRVFTSDDDFEVLIYGTEVANRYADIMVTSPGSGVWLLVNFIDE